MTRHEIQLFIINNPGLSINRIATLLDQYWARVNAAYRELIENNPIGG